MRPVVSIKLVLVFCLVITMGRAAAQTIVTYAGGVGNDTTAALYGRLAQPSALVLDGAGGLYILENSGVRHVDIAINRLTAVTTGGGKGKFDASGNWYFISSNRIYKKDPTGNITHIAGNGSGGYNFDDIPATQAAIGPSDLTTDVAGNVYIADRNNHRIRKINTSGMISTCAGVGVGGFGGDGGAATSASISYPSGVAVDGAGNIFITEWGNRRVRKISTSGIISTLAGTGSLGYGGDGGPATAATMMSPVGITADAAGNVYFADEETHNIRKISTSGIITRFAGNTTAAFSGDGGPASAASLKRPTDIALDATGGLYIADNNNNRIRYVNASGVIGTIAGNGLSATGFGGDGGNALLGRFTNITWLALNNEGALYILDGGNNRIRKVDASGTLSTVAGMGLGSIFGDGGQATAAGIGSPASVVADKLGNFYIAAGDRVRKVSPSGVITTFAGGGGGTPNGIPATDATIGQPKGTAVDAAGNIYVANSYGGEIYKIDAVTGIITTVAGNGSTITSGDGGPATAAGISAPNSVAFDKNGNMYIGGNTVRKVNTSGIISSLPCDGNSIAVDTMGNVYMVDGTIVRRYDIHGYLSVVTAALPGYSIAIDTANNLFFAMSNIVKKMGPLSTVIDYPPLFTKGSSTSTTVCVSSTSNIIDTFLKVTDNDMGQTLTWSITSGPAHGTLGGFPYSALSTGGAVVPSGINYTPVIGYSGSDNFRIKVSDGEDTAMIQVNVTVTATASAGSLTGANKVCVGASTDLNATIEGGTWSTNGTEAIVNDTGLVTGVTAGIDTVIYTINTYCGLRSVTRTVTVNQVPVPEILEPLPIFCLGQWVEMIDYGVPANGVWSVSQGPLQEQLKRIRGNAVGSGIIAYSITNECGVGKDSVTVNVIDRPIASTITGLATGCPGDVSTFVSTDPGGKWKSSNSTVASIDSVTGVINIHAAGSTQIVYETTNVCGTRSTSKTVNVPSSPYAGNISGDFNLCRGTIDTFNSSIANGVWSSGDTLIATIDNAGVVWARAAGIVPISYTVSNNCGTGSTVANLGIQPSPELTPITGKSVVITGRTATLKGRAPVGIWSSSDTTIAAIDQWGVLMGLATGTAVVTYSETNSYNCTSIETLQVLVTPSTDVEFPVYPNPANRTVYIAYRKSAAMDADVQFTDILGRVIGKGKMPMPSSSGVAEFDVSLFPAGVYTISVISADGNYIGRLVVAH